MINENCLDLMINLSGLVARYKRKYSIMTKISSFILEIKQKVSNIINMIVIVKEIILDHFLKKEYLKK